MSYNLRNYKVLGVSLCLLLNLAFCNQALNAQVQACPILVPIETTVQSSIRYFNQLSQNISTDEKAWINLSAAERQDDIYASVELWPGEKSSEIRFEQFGFNFPIGTAIEGIEIRLKGHTDGLEVTSDVLLQLLDQGNPQGMNLANGATYGTEWAIGSEGDDGSWSYGAPWYQWGDNWTMNQIMDSQFGFRLQVENTSDNVQTVRLDEVQLIVHYMPLFSLCDHDCVQFYVDDAIGADYYDWIMPEGFDIITGQPNEDIISIGVTTAEPGIHTICVQTVSAAGTSASCCRDFLYDDCRPSSVGDYVWFDENGNGIQDVNEGGIDNALVQLYDYYDNLVAEVNTDQNGYYLFSEIQKGEYYIKVNLPGSDFINTESNIGNDDLDSDITGANGLNTSDTFILNPGEELTNLDFGFTKYNSIAGVTWDDLNLDGIRQGDEPVLSLVKVLLFNESGNQLGEIETGLDGSYKFDNLYPGTYQVNISPFKAFVLTQQNIGSETTDSDFNINGDSELITLSGGLDYVNLDAGFNELGSIGDFVWRDKNGNGIQEIEDVGLSSIILNLYDANGLLASTTTGTDGSYKFEGLKTGLYQIQIEELPINYIPTLSNIGDDSLDSDLDSSVGMSTGMISLLPGENKTDTDLGLTEYGGIIGQVWNDHNYDGIQGFSEILLENIAVDLYDLQDNLIASTTTGVQGNYAFAKVFPGDYIVKFNTPIGYQITLQNVGSDLTDSDIDQFGQTGVINIMAAQMVNNINAGYIQLGSIGDYVWFDHNGNGIQDVGDNGLEGLEVNLIELNGTVAQTVYTNAQGGYLFENVVSGIYSIRLSNLLNGYIITMPNIGSDELDSDLDDSNGPFTTAVFELTPGEELRNIDMGFTQLGSISGLAWGDKNVDGKRDPSDIAMPGFTVSLLNEVGEVVDSQTTDQNGEYQFENVFPGNYSVQFPLVIGFGITLQDADLDFLDSDINSFGLTEIINLNAGDNIMNLDGGYIGMGSIGDQVFYDTNGNGIQDSFDPDNFSTIMDIHLFFSDGTLCQTVSNDATGHYAFANVFPGMYYLRIDITGGFTPTKSNIGGDNLDSDLDESNGQWTTSTFSLAAGQVESSIDIGLTKKGLIKGTSFVDINADGIKQNSDPLMEDVKVTLLDEDNNELEVDFLEDGCYTFGPLFPGNYQMLFEPLDNSFMPTLQDIGIEFNDSDIDENGLTDLFFLGPNEVMSFYDAGFYQYGSISGRIWDDINENGIEDIAEEGYPNIVVHLVNTDGQIVQTTDSDENGEYSFENVTPGTYTVRLELDDYIAISNPNVGPDDTVDSDFISLTDNVARSEELTVQSGTLYADFDGGIYLDDQGSICGLIWEDVNYDGLRQDTEPLITSAFVSVRLFTEDDIEVAIQTTNTGSYLFEDLSPGNYYVSFQSETMMDFTIPNAGDEDIDSDVDELNGIGTTDILKLDPKEKIDHVDAGFYRYGSISGRIWDDINENGIEDIAEDGYPNIVVHLVNTDGQIVQTTDSDENGNYIFENITPDSYTIQLELDDYIAISNANQGLDETVDSDFISLANNIAISNEISIESGSQITDVDGGIYLDNQGSICGVIWEDLNYDGLRQDTEPLITSQFVSVRLFTEDDVQVAIQTTNTGSYVFEDLPPGNYYVRFLSEMMMSFTIPNAGDDTIDSDIDQLNGLGTTDILKLDPKEKIDHVDGGFFSFGSISGAVWFDENCNGEQDFTELLVEGVEVVLLNGQNQIVQSTFTNNEGKYAFVSLVPDFYTINFISPDGQSFTQEFATNDTERDSDVVGIVDNVGSTNILELQSGTSFSFINAGLKNITKISGLYWNDVNCNGVNDNEGGVFNVEVSLYSSDNSLIESVFTNNFGFYEFENFPLGNYYVEFAKPSDFEFTISGAGGDPSLDSDVINETEDSGTTAIVEISIGNEQVELDAGIKAVPDDIIISGLVWMDQNCNGIRDGNESVLSNTTVTLLNDLGEEVLTTQTGDFGEYLFEGMDPGMYQVAFELHVTMIFTDYFIGTDQSINSDVENGEMGTTPFYSLDAGDSLENIDAGLKNVVNNILQGMVWLDENCNGLMDPDEPGIQGVGVNVYDLDGNTVSSAITALSGQYFMIGLFDGDYIYEFVPPSGYNFTESNIGTNDEIDSDVVNILNGIGTTENVSIGVNQNINDVDAGLKAKDPIEVSGLVFIDENCDGQFNNNELPVEGINVVLVDMNEMPQAQTTTDSSGFYKFTDLSEGSYMVMFELIDGFKFTIANIGDDNNDSDVTTMTALGGRTDEIVLTEEQQLNTVFAGIKLLDEITISGSVWNDLNCNGLNDIDEPTMMNIDVNLLDDMGGIINTDQTDDQGNYSFNGMLPGDYQVQFVLSDGYEFTLAQQGTNNSIDSDVININGTEGTTDIFSLVEEDQLINIDAGFKAVTFININGTVWEDINGNGLRNMDEMGEPGITVELYDVNNVLQDSDITDNMGNYSFSDFPQGTYYVVVVLPTGSEMTLANQGTNDLIDSDITSAVVTNSSELINSSIQQLDAGFFYLGSIGDFVWSDNNGNGIQDDGEEGINALTVRLFDINGNVVGTKFTGGVFSPDGEYLFTDLAPGFYYVSHIPTGGMLFAPPNVGTDDTIDSDINSANGFGTSHTITLLSGMDDRSVDIGLIQEPGSVGDRVWLDVNADGIQDPDEIGINDVLVTLKSESGNFVASTVTDFNSDGEMGYYSFENIQPGSYYIVFTVPVGYLISPVDQGGNDTQDSDLTSGMEFGSTNIFNLSAGENDEDVDAGFFIPAGLGDFVWNDLNQDGIQDADEPGVPNVVVNLHAFNGAFIMSTETDANGEYSFPFLAQGIYFISVVPPAGMQFSPGDQGGDDTKDSDVDPTGTSGTVVLAHAVVFNDLDVGLVPSNTMLGLRVWYDEDGDGKRDADELGMEGVDVQLMNSSGTMVYETTTNIAGKYIFDNIPSGTYYVHVEKPDGYEFTEINQGGNDDFDSDFDMSGNSVSLIINPGTQIMNIDAGLVDEENIIPNDWEDLLLSFNAKKIPSIHRLDWDLNEDYEITSLQIQRKLNSNDFETLSIIDEPMFYQGEFDDLDISTEGEYTYRLQIVTVNKSVLYSQEKMLAVHTDIEKSQLSMYPVPAINTATLELKLVEPSTVSWIVYNASGKVVLQKKLFNRQNTGVHYYPIDVKHLTPGNYYVKVQLERESLFYNISINK